MKQKFIKLVCLALCLMLCENVMAQQTSLTIDNQSPGWLSSKIGYGDQQTVENLKVTGYLNGTDLQFIQGLKNDQKLSFLDLSDAVIVAGGSDYITKNNVFSCGSLSGSKKLRRIDTPKSAETEIGQIADTVISNGTETSCSYIQLTPNSKVTRTPEPYYKYIQFGMNTEYVGFYPGTYYEYIYADGQTYYTGTLVLPHTIKTISGLYLDGGTIISYIDNPSNVDFQGGDIKNGIIYIPQGTMEVYSSSRFSKMRIVEMAPPTEIQLNKQQAKLFIDNSITLQANLVPEDAFYKELKWESSNESVATVNQYGEISAVSSGTADIIVSSVKNPEVKAICTVSVYEHTTGVNISDENIVVSINETKQLTANTLPLGTSDNQIIWSSDNAEVASVDEVGNIKGLQTGHCVIKATSVDGGFEAQCNVTVVQLAEAIKINKESTSLVVGNTETLTANILPDNTTDKTILWSSSNSNVATVDANGMVTANKAGECTITAKALSNPNVKATCDVTVIQPVTGITLSESTYTLKAIGESVQLKATVLSEDASNKKVNWSCPNNTVCVVSNGNVVAVGYGIAVIIAMTEDGGFMGYCTVTVEDTTGITDVKEENNDCYPTYDAMGRKVHKLKKGQLYIREGKKFIVR